MAERRVQQRTPTGERPRQGLSPTRQPSGPPAVEAILALQRAAGNRAVAHALGAGRRPVAQRVLDEPTGDELREWERRREVGDVNVDPTKGAADFRGFYKVLSGFVPETQLAEAKVATRAEKVQKDTAGVDHLAKTYEGLEAQEQAAQDSGKSKDVDSLSKKKQSLIEHLGEEPAVAAAAARKRLDELRRAQQSATQQRVVVEMLYDDGRQLKHSLRKSGTTASTASTETMKSWTQNAKLSRDLALVERAKSKIAIEGVRSKRKADFAKAWAKKVGIAVANFAVATATAGLLGVKEGDSHAKRLGGVFGNLRTAFTEFKTMIETFKKVGAEEHHGSREKVIGVLDRINAVLTFASKGFFDPIADFAGRISLTTGILSAILAAASIASWGAAAPLAAPAAIVLAAISTVTGFIALAAMGAKTVVEGLKLASNALITTLNTDARRLNRNRAAVKTSMKDTAVSAVSTASTAVGMNYAGALSAPSSTVSTDTLSTAFGKLGTLAGTGNTGTYLAGDVPGELVGNKIDKDHAEKRGTPGKVKRWMPDMGMPTEDLVAKLEEQALYRRSVGHAQKDVAIKSSSARQGTKPLNASLGKIAEKLAKGQKAVDLPMVTAVEPEAKAELEGAKGLAVDAKAGVDGIDQAIATSAVIATTPIQED